ncbi:MAG TPA: asparagine synthase (glutamine-hydrolyzing) [Solirubrobacteraceae bacterium]|nr:asparagine synthase (glutamine-hydrolyzing) [Solirubrobacteraceae bacterium]
MCGICGTVVGGGDTVDPQLLAAMNETLVHRGPDSAGSFVDGPVGLAMRRLSIIDLAGGDQPIANEDGTIQVIQNGEIYNYRDLRARLIERGHRFSTHSDTEVLVHLYEDEGARFVEQLRGMFGIALWDAGRRTLLLARDRFGIKPLYYHVAGPTLSFASELKALLRDPGVRRDIDLEALEAFLAFNWIPAPLTIFEGVRKLPAGHVLTWQDGHATVERYARPAPAPEGELRGENPEVLAEELRERLRDSVRAHLVADVPVGVLLSGGLDSSALAAFASMESSAPVATFSIGFKERAFSELEQARLIAQRYGTEHHELIVEPDAVELLPLLAETFDEPFADSSALPTWLVSRLAAGHVKVGLSGEGGDELFGGYYTYVADLLARRIGPVAGLVGPVVERMPSSLSGGRLEDRVKRFVRGARLAPLERHQAWTEVFSADVRGELLGRGGAPGGRGGDAGGVGDPLQFYRARYAETEGAARLARFQDVDLGLYLVDDLLVKTDRASMAHSLETRVPFLDTVVSDFALRLPDHLKVRGFAKKRLLRRALAPLLPREIIEGRKRGFSIPAAAWLRGELAPFAREVLSPARVREQGYFDPKTVSGLIDAHVAGREDYSRHLWGLLSFSLWYDRYARAPKPVAA